jgi:hypothetical protein
MGTQTAANAVDCFVADADAGGPGEAVIEAGAGSRPGLGKDPSADKILFAGGCRRPYLVAHRAHRFGDDAPGGLVAGL